MPIVVDATSSPSVDALRAADVVGVCRYLSWPHRWGGIEHVGINPKIIQQAEFDRLHAGGQDISLNWEYDDHDWMGNASAGTAHAQEAIRQATALGYPRGCAILGSADWDVSRNDWDSNARGYAWAFANMLHGAGYKAGVYGPYDLLTWCRDLGVFDVFWQAGMSWSWSGGRNRSRWPGAHLRQLRHQTIGGIDCDVNEIIQAEYGQYRGDNMAGDFSVLGMGDDLAWRMDAIAAGSETVRGGNRKGEPMWIIAAVKELQEAVTALAAAQSTPVDLDALGAKVTKLLTDVAVPAVTGAVRAGIDGATINARPPA